MINVVAAQAEIEYRHQRLVAEAEEYRRVRAARQPRRAPRSPRIALRARRSSAKAA
jgi:hypothetical protein